MPHRSAHEMQTITSGVRGHQQRSPLRTLLLKSSYSLSNQQRRRNLGMVARSYSLWAEPKGPLAQRLSEEIKYLAEAYGGPIFEPHVTVLGGFQAASDEEALQKTKELASRIKNYRIRFQVPSYGEIFHQCVFLLVHKEPLVMEASAVSRQMLGQDPDTSSYMPHLSLLYSDVDERIRRSIVEMEKQRLLNPANGLDVGFDVDSISLWWTEADDRSLKSWKKLEEFPLQGANQ